MSGHTPGPWVMVTGNSARQFHEISIRPINNHFPECGNLPFPIASVRYPQHDFGLSNARLIAESPNLLEELENCVDLLKACFPDAPVDSCIGSAIVKANAVIAKAGGAA